MAEILQISRMNFLCTLSSSHFSQECASVSPPRLFWALAWRDSDRAGIAGGGGLGVNKIVLVGNSTLWSPRHCALLDGALV